MSDTQSYDAFGEKLPAFEPRSAIGRRARNTGIAVFWSLAMLIIVGRVLYAPSILPAPMDFAAR